MSAPKPSRTTMTTNAAQVAIDAWLPRWLPPVLYAFVSVVIFRDFIFSGDMLYGGDTESLGYMARAFFAERLAEGDMPLWNPRLLGGTPFIDSLAGGDSLYPPSLLLLMLLEPYRALGWKLVLHVFAAGLFAHGWVRALGCSRAAALVAGLAYMVAPFLVTLIFPAHDGKLFVTALTPLLFWTVERWWTERRAGWLAATGGVVALVTLTTHFQMAYFLFMAVGAYGVFRLVQGLRDRDSAPRAARAAWVGFGAFVGASVLGAAAAGVQLVPAFDYVTEASRRTATTTAADAAENRTYASSWGLHPEEAFASLFVPEFIGGNLTALAPAGPQGSALRDTWVDGTYWGRNLFKLNHEYIGLAVVLLALVGVLGARRRGVAWFSAGLGGLALLYALGEHTPVWGLFYALVPGIELFRAPSMVIFLTGFAAVTLAALGVDTLIDHAGALLQGGTGQEPARAQRIERVLWAGAAALLVALVLAVTGALPELWMSLLGAPLDAQKQAILERAWPWITRGFFIAAALSLSVAGLASALLRGRLAPALFVAALAALVAVDGLRVDAPYVHTRDFDDWAARDVHVDFFDQVRADRVEPFRILDLNGGGQEVRLAMFGFELASGHHPNDLARYRTLIGMRGSGLPERLLTSAATRRLLNVEYLLWPEFSYGSLAAQEAQLAGLAGGEPVQASQIADGRIFQVVYQFTDALDRARLVRDVQIADDAEVIEVLDAGSIDPGWTALLAPEHAALAEGLTPLPADSTSAAATDDRVTTGDRVTWIESTPERAVLQVDALAPALLVMANNWYPSWVATIDEVEVPIGRAYLTLQALRVPAGTHTVVFEARAGSSLRAGVMMSVVGLLGLLGLLGIGVLRRTPARSASDEPGDNADHATA